MTQNVYTARINITVVCQHCTWHRTTHRMSTQHVSTSQRCVNTARGRERHTECLHSTSQHHSDVSSTQHVAQNHTQNVCTARLNITEMCHQHCTWHRTTAVCQVPQSLSDTELVLPVCHQTVHKELLVSQ